MTGFLKYILLIFTVIVALSLILMPDVCINAGKAAVTLCLDIVIPSLFPFLICSGLLTALGTAALCGRYLSPFMRPLFGIPGSGALCFMLGIVSGYPMGAVCAADLYRSGECTKSEAERMTAFCNNSGPLFIIGVVSAGILNEPALGRYLYLSHIFSAILTGICLHLFPHKKYGGQLQLPPSAEHKNNTVHALGSVIDDSVFSMLKICGFILFFSVIGATLPKFTFSPYIHAFLEITGGIKAVAAMDSDPVFKTSLISFFIAFSGVSVLLQVSAVTAPCGLSVKPYFFGKLLQGIISFAITYLMLTYFPITTDVFLQNSSVSIQNIQPQTVFFSSVLCIAGSVAILFAVCLLSKLYKAVTN